MREADAGQLPARRAEGPRRAAPASGCCCRGSSQEVVLLFPALSFLLSHKTLHTSGETAGLGPWLRAVKPCVHTTPTQPFKRRRIRSVCLSVCVHVCLPIIYPAFTESF